MQADLKTLEEKTKVFWHGDTIGTTEFSWQSFKGVYAAEDGTLYCIRSDPYHKGDHTYSSLPCEFFSHQVLGCKTRLDDGRTPNLKELAKFICDWGVPYSPYRLEPKCLPAELQDSHARAIYAGVPVVLPLFNYEDHAGDVSIGDTSDLDLAAINTAIVSADDPASVWLSDVPFDASSRIDVVSAEEVALTLELIQDAVMGVFNNIRANDENPQKSINISQLDPFNPINAASRCPRIAGRSRFIYDATAELGLTSAICTQLIETLADGETPWRECKAPDCNKRWGAPVIFKYQQNPRRKQKNPNAEYCSEACRERHKKQRQRARRKQSQQGR